jgi:hypothetical protein
LKARRGCSATTLHKDATSLEKKSLLQTVEPISHAPRALAVVTHTMIRQVATPGARPALVPHTTKRQRLRPAEHCWTARRSKHSSNAATTIVSSRAAQSAPSMQTMRGQRCNSLALARCTSPSLQQKRVGTSSTLVLLRALVAQFPPMLPRSATRPSMCAGHRILAKMQRVGASPSRTTFPL